MFQYDPFAIVKRELAGTGNMGDVLDRENGTARFSYNKSRFALVQVRANFVASSDQGVATMKMLLDHHSRQDGIASDLDFTLDSWQNMGFDASEENYHKYLEWAPPFEAWHRFVFEPGDDIVFTWIDPGTTDWGIEVGVVPQP